MLPSPDILAFPASKDREIGFMQAGLNSRKPPMLLKSAAKDGHKPISKELHCMSDLKGILRSKMLNIFQYWHSYLLQRTVLP